MENSMGVGLVAAVAVSGSVALIATHLSNRLLSDFMDKFEFELGNRGGRRREHKQKKMKRVRFAEHVVVFEQTI